MEMSHVFLFAFFFSLLLIFTLVAASISHFLTAPIKFSCFSSNEIGLLCLSLALALAFLSTARQTFCFLVVFFLFLKDRVAMQFTTETHEYLTCEILPLSYMKGWMFSEIKFLGCIDNKFSYRWCSASRTSSARVELVIMHRTGIARSRVQTPLKS